MLRLLNQILILQFLIIASNCLERTDFIHCYQETTSRNAEWLIRRPFTITFLTDYKQYTFTLDIFLNGPSKQVYHGVQRNTPTFTVNLVPGTYYTNIKITRDEVNEQANKMCWINIVASVPEAFIAGGAGISVPQRTPVIINVEQSFDRDANSDTDTDLNIEWTCSVEGAGDHYCSHFRSHNQKQVRIPPNFMVPTIVYIMSIEVSTPYKSEKAKQRIAITKEPIFVKINCTKNCPPYTDYTSALERTFLFLICEGCENYQIDWETMPSGSRDDIRKFKNHGYKLQILENRTQTKDFDLMTVTAKVCLKTKPEENVIAESHFLVRFWNIENVQQCKFNPSSGPISTKVKLQCPVNRDKYFFFVLYENNEWGKMVLDIYVIESEVYFIAGNAEFYLLRIHLNNVYRDQHLRFEITDLQNVTDRNNVEIKNIAMTLFKQGNIDRNVIENIDEQKYPALNKFLVKMFDEHFEYQLDHDYQRDFLEPFKSAAVTVMHSFSLKETLILFKQSKLAEDLGIKKEDWESKHFAQVRWDNAELQLTKFISLICSEMINHFVNKIMTERFPLKLSDDIKSIAKFLAACMDTTTEHLFLLSEVTITPNIGAHIGTLQKISNEVLNGTFMITKALTLMTAATEDMKLIKNKYFDMCLIKDLSMYASELQIDNITIKMSSDLISQVKPFEILVAVWNKDIMWWNWNRLKVQTNILSISIHDGVSTYSNRIKEHKNPFHVYFDKINMDDKEIILSDKFKIPSNYYNFTQMEYNRFIKIWRIDVGQSEGVLITFHSLSNAIDTATTKMKFPTIDDFKNNQTMCPGDENNTLFISNEFYYDIWAYLAILPNHFEKPNTEISYNVSFTVSSCRSFGIRESVWKPHCIAGYNTTKFKIHCQCNSFSILSAESKDVEVIRQQIDPVKMVLTIRVTYIIFIWTVLISTIYIILIILFARKLPHQVYFLADNNKNDLYSYLLIANTSNLANSGTTSNIVVKLSGSKRRSDPHLLNYPDPEKKLLQMNSEDWFILTTNRYLGNLKKIGIWFDGIGTSPSWLCTNITVYDMQTKKHWIFHVNKRLSVLNGVTYLSVKPEKKKASSNWVITFKNFTYFHTWNIVSCEENFSYTKRITLLCSSILTTSMCILLLMGLPTFSKKDVLDRYGHFTLDKRFFGITFAGSGISFLIHALMTYFFRTIIGILMISSITILIVYGFFVPYNSSLMWLVSNILGIIINMCLYENCMIVIRTLILHGRWRVDSITGRFPKILALINEQRHYFYKRFGPNFLRPYFQYNYMPLNRNEIYIKKEVEVQRKSIVEQIRGLTMIGIFIFVLSVIVSSIHAKFSVTSHRSVEDLLTHTKQFSEVASKLDVFEYLYRTMTHTFHDETWYGDFKIEDPAMLIDYNNKLLGNARIRQLRVIKNKCTVPEIMRYLNVSCYPTFSLTDEDRESSSIGWNRQRQPTDEVINPKLSSIWTYVTWKETGRLTYFTGHLASYPGTGYISPWGISLTETEEFLRVFIDKKWISAESRAILFEFIVYNGNTNIFNAVTLLFELTPGGYTAGIMNIKTSQLLVNVSEFTTIKLVALGLFLFWVTYLIIRKSITLFRNFRKVIRDIWFIVDTIILFISLLIMFLFLLRHSWMESFSKQLLHNKDEFVPYFKFFLLNEVIIYITGCLMIICTIRLWNLVRFSRSFRVFEKTVTISVKPFLSVVVWHGISSLAFGMVGVLVFGARVKAFHNLGTALLTLLLISFNLYTKYIDMQDFMATNMAYLYFSCYVILTRFIRILYVVVIIMGHEGGLMFFSQISSNYSLKHYIKEKYQNLRVYMKKLRLRGGGEYIGTKNVQPKDDVFRFANCVFTSKRRLEKMKYLTKAVLWEHMRGDRHRKEYNQDKMKLIGKLYNLYKQQGIQKEDKEVFYKGHTMEGKSHLVDERRIETMEFIANYLLTEPPLRPPLRKTTDIQYSKQTKDCNTIVKENINSLKWCNSALQLITQKLDKII